MAKQVLDIGFFSTIYSQISGAAYGIRFLAEALAKTGHNIHVFTPKIQNYDKIPKRLFLHELGGERLIGKLKYSLSLPVNKFFSYQNDYLDIAHIHTHNNIARLAVNECKKLRIPIIGSHHVSMRFYSAYFLPVIGSLLGKTSFFWWYKRRAFENYDLIHVPIRSKKEMLLKYKFKEPIISLTNGVSDYYFQDVKPIGIREKYNIEDKKVLLYVSRLSPEKHPIRIIKQFISILKQVPDAYLLFVGPDGLSSESVKRIIKKRKYKDFISYEERVPFEDLIKLYRAADVSCLWSWIEAEGLVLLEAMAQGTPNVGANGSGIKDVIRHRKTGFLANNLEEFEYYVVKLMTDDDLREEMGRNAKKEAEYYRISTIAKTWIKIYKFVIDNLYPLGYYKGSRNQRVRLVREFVQNLPNVSI